MPASTQEAPMTATRLLDHEVTVPEAICRVLKDAGCS
jgi:hypothetical protein